MISLKAKTSLGSSMVRKIAIDRFSCEAIVGVYDYERLKAQPLWISAQLGCLADHPLRQIAQQIRQGIEAQVIASRSHLIERLCLDLIRYIFQYFQSVQWACLRIEKPCALPYARTVGMELFRSRAFAQL